MIDTGKVSEWLELMGCYAIMIVTRREEGCFNEDLY